MNFSIIATPFIGACIGYITNYIAVKMLFRPLKPVKLGNFMLPFTPGIIPKEKNRLAKGIGEIVGKRLVTKDGLEKMLLSDRVKSALRQAIEEKLANSHTTLNDVMVSNLTEEKTQILKQQVSEQVAAHLQQTLLDSDIGKLLSEQIVKSIKEYFQGGFLAMMMNDSILNAIGAQIGEGITKYIANNGSDLLLPYINKECDNIAQFSLSDVTEFASKHQIPVADLLMGAYESVIQNNLDHIMPLLNITQIAEEQINQMDVLELEELILTVMKKELNAIVNLGAFIGLILGMLNLLI